MRLIIANEADLTDLVVITRKTLGNLISAGDALNAENEAAHVYLDECYINNPDACDAGTKPLVERIMDLDAAHGAEVKELQQTIDAQRERIRELGKLADERGAEVEKAKAWMKLHPDYYSDVLAWAERYAKEHNGNG